MTSEHDVKRSTTSEPHFIKPSEIFERLCVRFFRATDGFAGDALAHRKRAIYVIFIDEYAEANGDDVRALIVDEVVADMTGAEVYAFVRSGKLFAELGLQAEALLEGVTPAELRSDLSVEDIDVLGKVVEALQ